MAFKLCQKTKCAAFKRLEKINTSELNLNADGIVIWLYVSVNLMKYCFTAWSMDFTWQRRMRRLFYWFLEWTKEEWAERGVNDALTLTVNQKHSLRAMIGPHYNEGAQQYRHSHLPWCLCQMQKKNASGWVMINE